MDDIYKNIEEYNQNKICLVIKKLNTVVTELFISGRKLNISLVFIVQSFFAVPKNIGLNSMHYFILKIPNKIFNKLHLIIYQILTLQNL